MDPGFAIYKIEGLFLRSFGNLLEMSTDCNLDSPVHLEHSIYSLQFLELIGTHKSKASWSLSFTSFNGKYSYESLKRMLLQQKKLTTDKTSKNSLMW